MTAEINKQDTHWYHQDKLAEGILPSIPCTDVAVQENFIRELKLAIKRGVRTGIRQTFKELKIDQPFPGHSAELVSDVLIENVLKDLFGESQTEEGTYIAPSAPAAVSTSANVFAGVKPRPE
jgi:hypothetical protein